MKGRIVSRLILIGRYGCDVISRSHSLIDRSYDSIKIHPCIVQYNRMDVMLQRATRRMTKTAGQRRCFRHRHRHPAIAILRKIDPPMNRVYRKRVKQRDQIAPIMIKIFQKS